MKPHLSYQLFSVVAIAGILCVGGCGENSSGTPESSTSQPSPTTPSRSQTIKPFELGFFTVDELFAAGSGGCGMTLSPVSQESEPGEDNFLLFHGIEGEPMLMKINGELQEFELEQSEGVEFYGQKTRQVFSNAELGLTIEADVSLGELGELESVAIAEGTVSITAEPVTSVNDSDLEAQPPVSPERQSISVTGDAGC